MHVPRHFKIDANYSVYSLINTLLGFFFYQVLVGIHKNNIIFSKI